MENVSQTSVFEKNPGWPRKRYLAVIFVSFLFGTPLAIWLFGMAFGMDPTLAVMMFAIGALGSGFTLAKILAKKASNVCVLGIVFSLGVLVVYGFLVVFLIASAMGHNC